VWWSDVSHTKIPQTRACRDRQHSLKGLSNVHRGAHYRAPAALTGSRAFNYFEVSDEGSA
jgi:hypothetical protein